MAAQHWLHGGLMWALLALCLLIHTKDAQAQSTPPDVSKPCLPFKDRTDVGFMTVTNRCPNDTFKVSFVRNNTAEGIIYARGADATWVPEGAQYQWLGPLLSFTNSTTVPDEHVLVGIIRADGKQVVPKGSEADGSLVDVSSTKKSVCQLFWKGSNDFAIFRASLSPDGKRVIGNDFAMGERSEPGKPGTPCEEYFEKGYKERPAVEGRMMRVYDVGSCRIMIDDCSN